MKKAVTYIRVSTPGQATRDRDPGGYSIPAQREACNRMAETLNADIVAEFVDAGESARTSNRVELQNMLRFLQQNIEIDYVIVHKVDRLARKREDDVMINLAIVKSGAKLVSCTENIDETPSGPLVHGIMATIADFYSSNLSSEVVKGMTQKVKSGGTITRAPLGYINHREFVDGNDSRWVEIDESRADLVRLAFKLYSTGEYSLVALASLLGGKGLTSRATKNRAEHAITKSGLASILTNPYYTGITQYQGVQYPGKHPALIGIALFNQVQDILKARLLGEKQRTHMHYLKGTIFCGRCGSRLCVAFKKQRYMYFFCAGRAKRNGCKLPYLPAEEIEAKVAQLYYMVKLSPTESDQVRAEIHKYIKDEPGRL
jgi:site-specific DNA recombinase